MQPIPFILQLSNRNSLIKVASGKEKGQIHVPDSPSLICDYKQISQMDLG
jgi:hypothetical protein